MLTSFLFLRSEASWSRAISLARVGVTLSSGIECTIATEAWNGNRNNSKSRRSFANIWLAKDDPASGGARELQGDTRN